jgi:hypothetical protein
VVDSDANEVGKSLTKSGPLVRHRLISRNRVPESKATLCSALFPERGRPCAYHVGDLRSKADLANLLRAVRSTVGSGKSPGLKAYLDHSQARTDRTTYSRSSFYEHDKKKPSKS